MILTSRQVWEILDYRKPIPPSGWESVGPSWGRDGSLVGRLGEEAPSPDSRRPLSTANTEVLHCSLGKMPSSWKEEEAWAAHGCGMWLGLVRVRKCTIAKGTQPPAGAGETTENSYFLSSTFGLPALQAMSLISSTSGIPSLLPVYTGDCFCCSKG